MPMLSATLASGLTRMEPMNNEPGAIQGWTDALSDLFSTAAIAGGAPIVLYPAVKTAAQALFAAMSGMSAPGAAPQKIQDGITAFWGILVSLAPSQAVFPGFVIVTPPPTLPTIAALVTSTGMASAAAGLDEAAANNMLALAIYGANLGGLATPLSGPPTVAII